MKYSAPWILASLLLVGCASSPEQKQAISDYFKCVDKNAANFDDGKSSVGDIASAAIFACKSSERLANPWGGEIGQSNQRTLREHAYAVAINSITNLRKNAPSDTSSQNSSIADISTSQTSPKQLNGPKNAEADKLCKDYYYGINTLKDYQSALKWCRISAQSGYTPSQYILAAMYILEQGVSIDLPRGLVWQSLAATSGIEAVIKGRDLLAERLTSQELDEAKIILQACLAQNWNYCY